MTDQVCKCCGQTLPPEYPIALPAGPRIIFELVRKAGKQGIRSDRLYEKLYANRHDGGPHYKTVNVRISQLNNRYLAKYNLKIQGQRTGCREHGYYRLVNVNAR